MHPNDTLDGRLLAYEHADQKHLRDRLGYWQAVEKRMIRAQLAAEGWDPKGHAFEFEVSARQITNHAGDPSMRERQEAWRAALPFLGHAPPSSALTPQEWEFLAAHFQGANHPLAQSILAKALAASAPSPR